MKRAADKYRTPICFEVGDTVLVKLQPYKQSSIKAGLHHKMGQRYYGPFTVTRKINEVAMMIDLPQTSKIHLVFHVSKLKKKSEVIALTS